MTLEVGEILDGKVTGITKFGAFVSIPGGKSGLVHISEIANTYVSDVNEYLKNGQEVKVKVLAINPDGKINLSIKKALEPAPGQERERRPRTERRDDRPRENRPQAARPQNTRPNNDRPAPRQEQRSYSQGEVYGASNDASFEDKLSAFLKDSNSKMSESGLFEQQKRSTRRRK